LHDPLITLLTERQVRMKFGMRLFGNCLGIAALACGLWLCCLLPAAAAQPGNSFPVQTAEPTNSAVRETDFALRFPHPAALIDAIPAADAVTVAAGRHLAQNKPRLYSAERQSIDPQRQQPTGPPKWKWSLATGYRQDDLNWNIGGELPESPLFEALLPGLDPALAGTYVNVLSELSWTDVEILQLEFGLQRKFSNNLRLKGLLGYGMIIDGQVQDSDYAGDNRTLEFSRSNNGADDGDVWDFSVALGYDFSFLSDILTLTPLGGFSYHAQNLKMVDGVQTVSNFGWPVPLGPFDGLDSSYDTDWYGPWIGGEFSFAIPGKAPGEPIHRFWLGLEYHLAEYEAKANWNLRPDFAHPVSFEHEADGDGWVLTGGYSWFFTPRWALDIKGKYQKWETDPGIDRVFFFDGTSATARLNEVEWDSYSATIGICCRW
jgi:hypothetical protein